MTPDQQLDADTRRSFQGLAWTLVVLLFAVGAWCATAMAQTLTAPTRISPYDWACLDASGAVLSNHQRFDTAFVACYNNAAGAEIVGGRYRIARAPAPPVEPPVEPPPPPPAQLPAPTAVSATVSPNATNPGNHNVALSWLSVAGATGYGIERCTGATCTSGFIALGTTTNTAYTNANVPSGITYRYRIQGLPNGAWSALRSVTTPTATTPPPAPTGNALLQWTAPTENTNGTALTTLAGFRIVYGTSPGSLSQTVEIRSASTSAYTVESLASGTWYFAVKAFTTAGYESDLSNVATKVVP